METRWGVNSLLTSLASKGNVMFSGFVGLAYLYQYPIGSSSDGGHDRRRQQYERLSLPRDLRLLDLHGPVSVAAACATARMSFIRSS